VQHAGVPSWRFSVDASQLVTVALFIRDASTLAVPPDPDDPPRLTADIPNRSVVLGVGNHSVAGTQWLSWWRQILEHELRFRHRRWDALEGRTVRRLADLKRISDPPDFTALADRPQLRLAVTGLFAEGCEWERLTRLATPAGRGHLDGDIIRRIAEDVAFDRQVSPGVLDASAVVLPVEGLWWRRYAPGCVLCSVTALADSHVREAIIRDAFESNLEFRSA
jgi:hypothetical protein